MADIPQDPRQLARDILSGKIKLEDLQREQQRRQAGAPKPAARPAEDRPIPLPNMKRPQEAPPPANRQETIPMPAPLPVPQKRQPAPQRRPIPQQQKKVRQEPPKPVRPMPPAEPARQTQATPPATVATSQAQKNAATTRNVIKTAMRNPRSLRHAILLSEVLQPPVSMR